MQDEVFRVRYEAKSLFKAQKAIHFQFSCILDTMPGHPTRTEAYRSILMTIFMIYLASESNIPIDALMTFLALPQGYAINIEEVGDGRINIVVFKDGELKWLIVGRQ